MENGPTHETSDREGVVSAAKLFAIVSSSWMSQVTCVAAELCLAELLADGPKHAEELARATGCEPASFRRLMRALASLDFCTEHNDGSFELRPIGALLRGEAPDSLRSWTVWWGRHLWPAWGNLLHSVKTGESNRSLLTGTSGLGYVGCDAEAAVVFNHAMADITRLVSRQVVRAYDFSRMDRIVDVGGGYGELLAVILETYPQMHGILFDLPHAIKGASKELEKARLIERCELSAGSFFESVPGGGDAYLLKSILHNWNDERSTVILRHCRRAMPKHAKLLVVERIMPARMEPLPDHRALAWSDLNMLVLLEGRERTEAEFRALLASSGFKAARILPAALGFSVIECLPC
jgi:hypothetical protein